MKFSHSLFLSIILLSCLTSISFAQSDRPEGQSQPTQPAVSAGSFEYAGSADWLVGGPVCVRDSFLFSLSTNGLMVLNVADPEHPRHWAQVWTEGANPTDAVVEGNYIYISCRQSFYTSNQLILLVYDISDPHLPKVIGRLQGPGWSNSIALNGNYLYLGSTTINVIDISDPSAPVHVGTADTSFASMITDLTVDDSVLYAADFDIFTFGLKDPIHPHIEATWAAPAGEMASEVILDDTLIIAPCPSSIDPPFESSLKIIDARRPDSLLTLSSLSFSYCSLSGVSLDGHFVYCAAGEAAMYVVDISNPTNPQIIGCLDTPAEAASILKADSLVYLTEWVPEYTVDLFDGCSVAKSQAQAMADSGDFEVINVSDPTNPTLIGTYPFTGYPQLLTVNGGLAVTGSELGVLSIVDVSHPDTILQLATLRREPLFYADIHLRDSLLFLAYGSWQFRGLEIVQLSDPRNPVTAKMVWMTAECVDATGNFAYATAEDTLTVIDISDPTGAVKIGEFNIGAHAWDILADGDYLYIAAADSGILIYSVADPFFPTLVGRFTAGGALKAYSQIAKSGNTLYAMVGLTAYLIDVSVPEAPTLITTRYAPGSRFLAGFGDLILTTRQDGGVLGYFGSRGQDSLPDITFNTPGLALGIAADSPFVYVADYYSLIRLRPQIITDVPDSPHDDPLPCSFHLSQNYPNPFNPSTRISYDLPKRSHVRLVVFDLLGREVKVLADQFEAAGSYSVIWDGRNSAGERVASGVYLYKLSTDTATEAKKMLLLK